MTRPDKHPHGKKKEVRKWMLYYDREEARFLQGEARTRKLLGIGPVDNREQVRTLQHVQDIFDLVGRGLL